jgi:hypothetical protein
MYKSSTQQGYTFIEFYKVDVFKLQCVHHKCAQTLLTG